MGLKSIVLTATLAGAAGYGLHCAQSVTERDNLLVAKEVTAIMPLDPNPGHNSVFNSRNATTYLVMYRDGTGTLFDKYNGEFSKRTVTSDSTVYIAQVNNGNRR